MSPDQLTYDMSNSQNTGNTVTVPKLKDNASNWVDYEAKVTSALGAKGLKRFVEGKAVRPSHYDVENEKYVTAPNVLATDDEIEAKDKKIDEYDQRDSAARNILLASVSPRLCSKIRALTVPEMWVKIKQDATDRSEMHVSQIKRRLHHTAFDGTIGGMRSQLNSLTEARDELVGTGHEVTDFTSIIINSMDESYHDFVSAVSGSARLNKTPLEADNLVVLLIEEDDYRKREQKKKKSKGGDHALSANRNKTGKNSSLKCGNCSRKGHIDSDCYQPGGGKEGQAPWQKKDKDKSANKATDSKPKSDDKAGKYAFTIFRTDERHALTASIGKTEAAVDSGASVHYCPDRSKFTTYEKVSGPDIYVADGRPMKAIGKGDIEIELPNKGTLTKVTLRDVYHVPDMTTTLISVARLDKAGFIAHFGQGHCRIEAPDKKMIAEIPLQHGLYVLGAHKSDNNVALSATQKLSLAQAHKTLGHIHYRMIVNGIRLGNIVGIELTDTEEVFCDACTQAKPHRKPFPQEAKNHAKDFGEQVVMD